MSDSNNVLQHLLEVVELYRFAENGIRYQQQKNLDQLEADKVSLLQKLAQKKLKILTEYRETKSKETLQQFNQLKSRSIEKESIQHLDKLQQETVDYLDTLRHKFQQETLTKLDSIYKQNPLNVKHQVRKLDLERLCQTYHFPPESRLCEQGNVQLLKEFTRELTKPNIEIDPRSD